MPVGINSYQVYQTMFLQSTRTLEGLTSLRQEEKFILGASMASRYITPINKSLSKVMDQFYQVGQSMTTLEDKAKALPDQPSYGEMKSFIDQVPQDKLSEELVPIREELEEIGLFLQEDGTLSLEETTYRRELKEAPEKVKEVTRGLKRAVARFTEGEKSTSLPSFLKKNAPSFVNQTIALFPRGNFYDRLI